MNLTRQNPNSLHCNRSESSCAARIFQERTFCFLAPRRRSGERTEERGCFYTKRTTHLLSPARSSTSRRRGSYFGCGYAALRLGGLQVLLALALMNGLFAAAQQTNAPAGTNYSSFQIIAERNIFDPNRYPRASRSNRRTTSRSATTFSLVGTMSYKNGMLAFFDGTDSDHRKVLPQNGVIAGYRVVEITLHGVKLESAGKPVEMKVGAQMRQESKGEWQLAGPGELPPSTAENEVTATNETPPSAGSSSEGNDVLKKLMQQREQELK
jgi:hypothetical protein